VSDDGSADKSEDKRPAVTVPGTVEKIIKPVFPGEPEKAEIAIENADPLYREIRVENALVTADGDTVVLKKGAQVDVTIEAHAKDTIKKSE
jgi:hypothetical protein